jgi:hypothetical protein
MAEKTVGTSAGGVERLPIIEINGPEPGVIFVPISNSDSKILVKKYWSRVQKYHDTIDDAQDDLENNNQQFNPNKVEEWTTQIDLMELRLTELHPIDFVDADGKSHELNTDPKEVLKEYRHWLDRKDALE